MGHSIFKADYPLMQRWLNRKGYSGSINDMFDKYFKTLLGGGTGTVNNLAHTYFGTLGYTGDTGERLNSFFTRVMGINNPIEAQRAFFGSDSTGFDIGAPTFEGDFSTGIVDSRITYTGASLAMRTNSEGLLVYKPHNLETYSESFDAWSKIAVTVSTNEITAPDGTLTADRAIADGTSGPKGISNLGTAHDFGRTLSVYAKAGTNSFIQFLTGADATQYVNFDLSTGTSVAVGTGVSASITSVGNGWYRCSMSSPSTTATTFFIALVTSINDTRYLSNTLATDVYLWGAQIENGLRLNTYNPTTTTAYYGPRIDYDASACIYTNNIQTYSEEFGNARWAKSRVIIAENVTTAPDGTMTADKLFDDTTSGGSYISFSGYSYIANKIYTKSIYLKKAELDTLSMNWFASTGWASDGAVIFNLTTGSATPSGTVIGHGIQSVGNGWYRCHATMQFGATSTTSNYPALQLTYPALDGSSGVYIWGHQMQFGSTLTDYVKTTLFPQKKLDSTSSAPVARGLLIEEQRTNLLLYSNDFTNAAWTALSTKRITSNTHFSLDGLLNASTFSDTSAGAFEGMAQTVTVPNDSASYAFSIYVLKTTGGVSPKFGADISFSGGTPPTATNIRLNTDTGAVTGVGAAVEDAGEYWRFIGIVTNNSTGNTSLSLNIYPAAGVYAGADSSTATGSNVIFGAQLEAGAFVTSYIPTTSASATRAVDMASMTGTNFSSWFNTTQGSFFYIAYVPYLIPLTYPRIFVCSNAAYSSYFYSYVNGSGTMRVGTDAGEQSGVVAVTSLQRVKVACTYSSTGIKICVNGNTVYSAAYTSTYSLLDKLTIGQSTLFGSNSLSNSITNITYYPTVLTDSQMQALTT